MENAGIYIHIPFCSRKCGYCDFNAYSGYKDGTKQRYVDALCMEIRRSENDAKIPTIFFGGGTPTNLSATDLARILDTVRQRFAVEPDAEITVEANPSDVDIEYLSTLHAMGFNRLSFGVQTFNDTLLRTIDRLHTGADAVRAIGAARDAGFDNLSLDLMFALPRQTVSDWERTLDSALALEVPHLSIYSLIIEEGTPFYARRERGRLSVPSEKSEATMFGRAIERVTAVGYEQYEISNYAKPGYRSRHNQIYWNNDSYFGFGAGAVSYRHHRRATNIRRPSAYIDAVHACIDLIAEVDMVTAEQSMGETIMLALRMREGLSLSKFADRYGIRVEDRFRDVIERHTRTGLLETVADHLRLTIHGMFLANEVMADFLP